MSPWLLLILSLIVLAGWAYWLLASWSVWAFFHSTRSRTRYRPFVSILKPVKGVDDHALENFASFCLQEYPKFEILFGVADRDDPVVPLIRQLQEKYPEHRIRLIVAPVIGINPKASTLQKLAEEARGEVLVISDSDIRVHGDYLIRVVTPLADPEIGVVTCPYRADEAKNFAAQFEALLLNTTFVPSAITAAAFFGDRIGLGATIAVRNADLERIGNFASFADYLADDYQLATRIAGLGMKISLSDCVVSSVLGPQRFSDSWARELRWARGIRVSCPWKYPGMLLTYPTAFAILLAATCGSVPIAAIAIGGTLVLRWAVGLQFLTQFGQRDQWKNLPWLPIRDLFSTAVWFAGAFGRGIHWRGSRFILRRDGRLEPAPISAASVEARPGLLRRLIAGIDGWLRRRQGIFEYTQNPECILRLSRGTAPRDIILPDDTQVAAGEVVGELHMWNEHAPTIPAGGPSVGWAKKLQRGFKTSLQDLAAYVPTDPSFASVRVFHAAGAFVGRNGNEQIEKMARHYGFETIDMDPPKDIFGRIHFWGDNLLVWLLGWTFNPRSVWHMPVFNRKRQEMWLSRDTLMRLFGPKPAKPSNGKDSAGAPIPGKVAALSNVVSAVPGPIIEVPPEIMDVPGPSVAMPGAAAGDFDGSPDDADLATAKMLRPARVKTEI